MTHLSEILTAELALLRKRIAATGGLERADLGVYPLDIVETGTIRNTGEAYRINDGWSTLTFVEEVAANGGSYLGIDLNVDAAVAVLKERGLIDHAYFMQGHSLEVLAGLLAESADLGRFDVAFLDSDNDSGLILHEYLIVSRLMNSPGLIMVDDVDPDSTGVVKGHQIIPWLAAHAVPFRLEKRHGDGYTTGVLIIEV